jgi:hypothetical protein
MLDEDVLWKGRWRSGGAAFGFVMVLRGLVFSVFPAFLFLCFGFRTMHGFFVMRIDIGNVSGQSDTPGQRTRTWR